MLSLLDNRYGVPRRSFLRAGLSAGSLALPQLFNSSLGATHKVVRDKAVVFIFMHGGPSQIETFDPKMSAPTGNRSCTGEVKTTIPGVTFGGTFPKLASRANKLSIVRSFSFEGKSDHNLRPLIGPETFDAHLGCFFSRVAGSAGSNTGIPNNVMLLPQSVDSTANPYPQAYGSFIRSGTLGSSYAPLIPGGATSEGSMQQDMKLNLSRDRLNDRKDLLSKLDGIKKQLQIPGFDDQQRQAFEAIIGGAANAFDISKEDPKTIEKYDTSKLCNPESIRLGPDGKQKGFYNNFLDHGKTLGKELLLARRLVEAGCGFVALSSSFVWDMHGDANSPGVEAGMNYVGPIFDHAVSAFLDDLQDRGLSDKVLVVALGEMGRTPKIDEGYGGRNHWAKSGSLMLSGGGLQMGRIIGQTTRDGGEPATDPVTIANLYSTIMHTLFDVGELRLVQGIPREIINLATGAEPIPGL